MMMQLFLNAWFDVSRHVNQEERAFNSDKSELNRRRVVDAYDWRDRINNWACKRWGQREVRQAWEQRIDEVQCKCQ